MGKSVLIFSASDSRHVYNFTSIVLGDEKLYSKVTIFNIAYIDNMPKEFSDYYANRGVKICNPNKSFGILPGPLKSMFSFFERTIALYRLLKKEHFDYAIIHFCTWQSIKWVNKFKNKFKHIIPVFWGGDILRNAKVANDDYMQTYKIASAIVLPNVNTFNEFNSLTNQKFENKAKLIQFPKKMVGAFLEAEKSMPSKNIIKDSYGFPEDKLIVICGHTATRAERFEQIIEQLCILPKHTLNKCYFVFMMTYAPEEYQTYQMEVEESINSNGIPGCVLKEYLNYNDIQKLHAVSDIHITNIKTDALSCFLQEQMLSGSVLLYGKWLKYYDIETPNFYAVPFEDITKMSSQLEEIVSNFEHYKQLSSINRDGIINLASEEVIINEWNKILNQNT